MHTHPFTRSLLGIAIGSAIFIGCNEETTPSVDVPLTCNDLTCDDENRSCVDGEEGTTDAVCGACFDGFSLHGDTCVDINECAETTDLCHSTEICVNTPGAYTCQCEDGFLNQGDGCEIIITDVALGYEHTCAVAGGGLYCWGDNESGQLGLVDLDPRDRPTRVGTRNDWTDVTAGGQHTCAIAGGELYCWGANNVGQVGDASSSDSRPLTRLGEEYTWDSVTAGENHTCAIADNRLFCWGSNARGELGIDDPSTNSSADLNEVQPGTLWLSVVSGAHHTCAITTGGTGYCWGKNESRQCTSEIVDAVYSPVFGPGLSNWKQSATGYYHTCAIMDQALYCWGGNHVGQIGFEIAEPVGIPTQINPTMKWDRVSTRGSHTCAISDHTLYCWGSNFYGQLVTGNWDSAPHSTPLEIPGDHAWDEVYTSRYSTCALSANRLFCWGDNEHSKLVPNNGQNGEIHVPTRVEFP